MIDKQDLYDLFMLETSCPVYIEYKQEDIKATDDGLCYNFSATINPLYYEWIEKKLLEVMCNEL